MIPDLIKRVIVGGLLTAVVIGGYSLIHVPEATPAPATTPDRSTWGTIPPLHPESCMASQVYMQDHPPVSQLEEDAINGGMCHR